MLGVVPVSTNQDQKISVEVDGYPDHYWSTTYNQTYAATLEPDNHATIVRGANFVLHLYNGEQGRSGQYVGDARSIDFTNAVPNANPNVLWTYVKPNDEFSNRWPECASSGVWLALIHG